MIANFVRIAVRNISRHIGYTLINVTGLAVGLTVSLLILLWVQDELSFEKFNLNAEHIYRVEMDQQYSSGLYHTTVTPHPGGPVWKGKIPEINEQVRTIGLPRTLFRQEDKVFFESSIIAADSGLFKIFTLQLLMGDTKTPLNSPHSIVLTEKIAKKYFGDINPIGKTLTLENKYEFTVTAVLKDLPKNSIFTFRGVVPYSFLKEIGSVNNSWGSNSVTTWVLLENGSDIKAVNKKLTDIVHENNAQTTSTFSLFPLLDVHLHSQSGFTQTKSPVIAVYIYILIAIIVLLIACINFINLSTAKASSRAKEIAIKKVTGADQMTLIIQFMLESLLLVIVAMILTLILVGLSLEIFNNISGKKFFLSDLIHLRFIISFIIVGILASFISGIYPALYLSSFKPVAVLKGDPVSGKGSGRLRQILVVIQFALSILGAIAAIFIYLELKFLQEKELGYNKDNLICIQMAENMKSKYYPLKRELQRERMIEGVTASFQNPVMIRSNSGGAVWEGKDPDKFVQIGINFIDYDFIKNMKIELVSGRDFSRDFPSDFASDTTGNFLINEETARIMGVGDPVGKGFRFAGYRGKIVGIMKDFNFKGADQAIGPMAFVLTDTRRLNMILIRLTSDNIFQSLKSVEKIWKEMIPEYPIEYSFIDQDYDNLFRSQKRLAELLKYFTILAVIIACLGLYGLSSYSAERRTKEVGIRKAMGAGSLSVMFTLSKEFLLLVLISLFIAIPLGWIIVDDLLKQFAYRIDISMLVFAVIAAGAIIIAMLTVSLQAYKATGINPAEAFKVE